MYVVFCILCWHFFSNILVTFPNPTSQFFFEKKKAKIFCEKSTRAILKRLHSSITYVTIQQQRLTLNFRHFKYQILYIVNCWRALARQQPILDITKKNQNFLEFATRLEIVTLSGTLLKMQPHYSQSSSKM